MAKAWPLSTRRAALVVATLIVTTSVSASASWFNGEPDEKSDQKRNVTASLLAEFASLRGVVGQAWHDLEEVSSVVGPLVKRLSLKAAKLREVIDDAKKLRVPNIAQACEELGSCSKCAASSVCGWCSASMKCVPGNRDGPADEAAPCPAAQYSY